MIKSLDAKHHQEILKYHKFLTVKFLFATSFKLIIFSHSILIQSIFI